MKDPTERTPGNQKKCPQCGVVFDARVLDGLCPNCLWEQGVKWPSLDRIKTFEPPSVESLAKVMRRVEPIEFIGQGGMGAVYKGRQYILNRTVALKVMPPHAVDGCRRFEREVQSLARLNHRNIVRIYEFGLAGNFPYFAMDFVDGPSLRQMLKSGPLDLSQATSFSLGLCDGLQHAHERHVVHRDIKPENLLVDKEGILRIIDFGLAKLSAGVGASSDWQTSDGRPVGTLGYMAPEQILKPESVDRLADIYSVAAVVYEMFTGKPPLGRFPAPSEKANVNSSLDEVLFKALETDVARRYQTILEFKEALQAAFNRPSSTAPQSKQFKQAVEVVVFNQNEPLQEMDRSDLQRQRQRLERALYENRGDALHIWEQLKQICRQLNDKEGSIWASVRLFDIYQRQGRLAETILEGKNLMSRLPEGSKVYWQVRKILADLQELEEAA